MTLQIKDIDHYKEVYQQSVDYPGKFWADQAETFTWKKKWDRVMDCDMRKPDIKWFTGGKLNITENCLDRHLAERPNQVAILWEPNNQDTPAVSYTYRQ